MAIAVNCCLGAQVLLLLLWSIPAAGRHVDYLRKVDLMGWSSFHFAARYFAIASCGYGFVVWIESLIRQIMGHLKQYYQECICSLVLLRSMASFCM